MQPIIAVNNLSKRFGTNVALDSIDFKIQPGEIFGFLGPSGSGKTTTINILTGQLAFDSGAAIIFGKEIKDLSRQDLAQIGIVSDNSGFYEKLSLYKNLEVYARIHKVKMDKVDKLLKDVGLYESRKTAAGKLSTGMKQRMLLVRALINSPKVLFLDEPTSGLDPNTSRHIHTLLDQLRNDGVSIFLTTHDMHEASKLCDQLVLLHNGKIVEAGSPEEMIYKYNEEKTVKITYIDKQATVVALDEINAALIEEKNVSSIHTLEPTLEEIFIKLTGVNLGGQ